MSERSYQQKLVWTRVQENLADLAKVNEKVATKASLIATSSSAVVALVSGAKFLPSQQETSIYEATALAIGVFCSVLVYWWLAEVLKPRTLLLPGSPAIETLTEQYLEVDEDDAFELALADMCTVLEHGLSENVIRGTAVVRMVYAFQAQLTVLAIALVVRSLIQ